MPRTTLPLSWKARRAPHPSISLLRRQLREARSFGLDTLDAIIADRPEYTRDFRRDYLGWHIHYHLGTDERRGLARFLELLRKLHLHNRVQLTRYVLEAGLDDTRP